MNGAFSVELGTVRKQYGDRVVLDTGSFELESGHSYALVGPNGSGKSTLLRVLAGVETATESSVKVKGEATYESLTVGYMPQKSYVFGFTVFRNVSLALATSNLPRDEVAKRVEQALAAVGMEDMADARGGGLSGGEAQRVALARLLVQDLDVMLLDEPTASMDIAGTMLVEKALQEYRDRTGCMLVTATHAPSQARRISDTAIMLSAGAIVEFGETETVLSAPTSEAGREFLSYWMV